MKVKITKPIRVNALGGEVEVSPEECSRLLLLGAAEIKEVREIPETPKRTTRKAK